MSSKIVCDSCNEIININQVYVSIPKLFIRNVSTNDFYKNSEIYDVDICEECIERYTFKEILGLI